MLLPVALLFAVLYVYYSYHVFTGNNGSSEYVDLSCVFCALTVGTLFAELLLWLDCATIARADRLTESSPLGLIIAFFGVMVWAALLQLALALLLDAKRERKLAGR